MNRTLLEAIVAARAAKRPVVVMTPLAGGPARLWSPGEDDRIDSGIDKTLRDAAARALRTDDAFAVDTAAGRIFVNPINPPLRLVIIGAVHITQPLSSMAAVLGYEVAIIDPRSAFARRERWPSGVLVETGWPDEVLTATPLDARTALVALTHDPKIDDPALIAAVQSRAFYIGALGSKKTHASRLARLAGAGFGEGELGRIHGPVGLDIGAKSPGEIAVAILGQMTAALRRGAPSSKEAHVDSVTAE